MKLRRVRITENSEQDAAEFVILPGLREQACRRGIRRLTALESDRRKIEETYLKAVDIGYSYRLAKKMEEFKSNPVLGYRTAGSKAEFDTGEFLKAEMERIGLSDIHKDELCLDSWEFEKAVMRFTDRDGEKHEIQLGAYQTEFVTDGWKEYPLVYAGRGKEADYDGVDVTGCLVMVDINQRDEWWINYPVYQAHLKGAAAVIAVQDNGYAEIDSEALNAQDIAGPKDAPAFSMSKKDAEILKTALKETPRITVQFDAKSVVKEDMPAYNVWGTIPGKSDDMILLSGHYDSYFDGFQDDNTAVALMFGIAKALRDSGFQPNNTIVICAMASEEWGVVDSNFDWSTGAYEQIFTAHPEWVGKVIADLNFELPALAHGTRARIRSCYEYVSFLEEYLADLPNLTIAYPEETAVTSPIETWSDDFSMAIAGVPSMVNDFTGGSFMETHYHSQFDNDEFYDEQVYRLHHELFALLILALDETAVVPLQFSPVVQRIRKGLEQCREICYRADVAGQLGEKKRVLLEKIEELETLSDRALRRCREEYEAVEEYNRNYKQLLRDGKYDEAEGLFRQTRPLEQKLLARFKQEQDAFVRIDWYGNVLYPHEICSANLRLLGGAVRNLKEQRLSSALRKLYQVDNNAYAFNFDEEVYRHFTDYVFHQPKDRLKWGYGRLPEHENLYGTVKQLLQKEKQLETLTGSGMKEMDYREEITSLEHACSKLVVSLMNIVQQMEKSVTEIFGL